MDGAPVEDAALLSALREMIQPDKLEELSMKTVMRALREKFGEGVRSRKAWVSEQVTAIVQGLGDSTEAAAAAADNEPSAAASESEASDLDLSDGEEPAAQLTDAELALQMQAEFNNEGLRARRAPAPKRKRPAADDGIAPKKKRQTGYAAPMLVMEPLLSYLRETGGMGPEDTTIPRSAVQKHLTDTMKAAGLINPKDGREFLLNEELQAVFKRKKLTYFSLAKHLTPLLKRPEDVGVLTAPADDEDEDEEDEGDSSADEDDVNLSSSDSDEATAASKPKKAKAHKAKSGGQAKAKAKASVEADGPKRPTSSYMYYAADRREWFKEHQPDLKMTEVAKLVGAEWQGLSDKRRKKYTDLAAKDKGRYEREKGQSKGKLRKKTKSKAADGQKQPNTGGLNAPMVLSAELQAVCGGERVLSRAQVMKHIWAYIKANDLQNPENKQLIQCDAPLLKITGGQQEVRGFSISKFLAGHLSKPTDDNAN